jgi:hypothetical protein
MLAMVFRVLVAAEWIYTESYSESHRTMMFHTNIGRLMVYLQRGNNLRRIHTSIHPIRHCTLHQHTFRRKQLGALLDWMLAMMFPRVLVLVAAEWIYTGSYSYSHRTMMFHTSIGRLMVYLQRGNNLRRIHTSIHPIRHYKQRQHRCIELLLALKLSWGMLLVL